VLIAQITDTHIRPKGKLLHHMVRTARALRRCVAEIEALQPRPDLVLATGDLVEDGKPKEYRRLRRILDAFSIPVFVIPGNHDARGALREAFADHSYLPAKGPLHYALDTLPLRLVALDTLRRGKPGGELDDERLAWLDAQLAREPTRPTLVVMHHPPFDIGVPPVDAHGFRGRERFLELVRAHPQIVRIVCGHVHRFVNVTLAHTVATAIPSTAPQLVVARHGPFYRLQLESPSYALHRWDGRTLRTTIQAVEAARTMPAAG
jgi:3',5'-cyclic AMP phosphodiesterase CpdA